MDDPMDTSGSGAAADSSRRWGYDGCHVHTSGVNGRARLHHLLEAAHSDGSESDWGSRAKRSCGEAVVREHVITIVDIEASADAVILAGWTVRVDKVDVFKKLVARARVQDSSRWKEYKIDLSI